MESYITVVYLYLSVFKYNKKQMKISKVALLALRGMERTERQRLAREMGTTEDTLYRWIRINDEKLTLAANLTVIKKEFGLSDEQVLEDVKVAG